ncbi:MAG: hypothetical protein PHO02_02800 [Candidatus Nanoarchaeia archaeon]|nr:hypothetical protein [Candidatus Nanoarchaeia archaeon]
MDSAYFQILFSKKIDFAQIIKQTLLKISEANNNLVSKENIEFLIGIEYIKLLSNDRYLVGFKLILDDSISEEELGIYCESLDNIDECEFLIKFRDKYLFDSLKKYYEEIFDIEMQLREILSFIFIAIYENDCYSFLEFQKQKVNLLFKGVKEENVPDFLKNKYQNEFFYLTFNQYRQLKLPDIIKSETLINLMADSKSFDELKKGIKKLGAIRPEKNEYLEFLNRISENLESIEFVRNCVAHNREPSDEELDNYNVAKEKLQKEMSEFFSTLNSLCPECGGKIIETQKTIYRGYEEDQEPVAIKYRIGCSNCDYTIHEETIDI